MLPFKESSTQTELPRCLFIEMEPNTDARLTWVGISLRGRGKRPEAEPMNEEVNSKEMLFLDLKRDNKLFRVLVCNYINNYD